MLRGAAVLSLLVVLACGVWLERITANDGPDRSVDLTPLAPIVVAVVSLLVIWAIALLARGIIDVRRGLPDDDELR